MSRRSTGIARMRGAWIAAGAVSVFLTACAAKDGQTDAAAPPTGENVLGERGAGTGLETYDVRRDGRRLQVRVYNRGTSGQVAVVTSRSFRGLDRSDARLAYAAAFEAGQKADCQGAPLNVLADTATFQEEGRRSAFTNGEAAWIFQARCG